MSCDQPVTLAKDFDVKILKHPYITFKMPKIGSLKASNFRLRCILVSRHQLLSLDTRKGETERAGDAKLRESKDNL